MARPMSEIEITTSNVNAVAVAKTVATDRLSGTVLQNKQVFDKYPDMIVEHFNDLCDYVVEEIIPQEGDCGLDYSIPEISYITTVLGCTAADITL